MKKFLSIVLCLAMLMSTVPVSVFAAPATVTTGDSIVEITPELPVKDSAEAELAADTETEYTITYDPGFRYVSVSGNGISGNTVPRSGKNGEEVTLPNVKRGRHGYVCDDDRYVIDGWTDGKNEYAAGDLYTITGDVTFYPNLKPVGDGYKVTLSVDEQFADSYKGFKALYVAVGDSINLSSDTFAVSAPVGYTVLGWKNAATGEFVTNVTGAKDEVVSLVAGFEFRAGMVFETAEKVSELVVVAGASSFDETVPGVKVVPESDDCAVTFGGLKLDADKYSFVDITYVNSDYIAAANGGEVVFAGGVAYASSSSAKAEYVTYRYDLAASEGWLGTCAEISIKPCTGSEAFTIAEIKFVENETVGEIRVEDLTVPAISETPDVEATVPADAVYEITSITWDPADKYFMGSTEYTSTVELAINKSGYMFDENTVALLNDEETSVEVSAKNATITKVFAATEAPKALEITLTSANAITVNDGTLELAVDIAPVNAGDVILPDTYSLAITSGDDIATLNGNVLTAKWDGIVEVTVTPDYDAAQAKTFEIEITNQVGYTVTYDKNTGADVSNMITEPVRAKKNYTVTSLVPTREGFAFEGWMISPDAGVTVTDIKISKDVTLYAKWTRGGFTYNFDDEKENPNARLSVGTVEYSKIDTEKGVLEMKPKPSQQNTLDSTVLINSANNSPLFNGGECTKIIVRMTSTMASDVTHKIYYTSKDSEGNDLVSAFAEATSVSVKAPINPSEYTEVVFDMSNVANWTGGNITSFRFDPLDGGATLLDHVNSVITIDYIRVVGADSVEMFELDVTAPEASKEVYGLEAVSTSSNKYEIKNITWEGPELVDGKYYAGSSEYTATVELKAASGYAFSDAPVGAFVNGEAADVVVNGDKAVVTYTFPATETLEEVEVQAKVKDDAPAVITESFGTLQLIARVVPLGDGDIDNDEVYWSIDPSQKKYAWVDENGLVTGNTDCEKLVVTASSKYDPSKKATVEIKISGQIPEKNVYFEAGTGETVTNLRGPDLAKDEYILPMDMIPERKNYAFKGWSKELGGEIITVDDVKEDTTYYAVWGYALGDEMKTSTVFTISGANNSFADGFMNVAPLNGKVNEGFAFEKENIKFKEGIRNVKVATASVDYLEIKTTLAPDELELCVYVQNADESGKPLINWPDGKNGVKDSDVNTRFYSNKVSIANAPEQNIADYVEKRGEWYIYKLPAKLFKNWTEYLYRLRLNFIRRDVTAVKASDGYLEYPAGTDIKFDYVRFVGNDIPAFDITGVVAPVVFEKAVKTAVAAQKNAFEVTEVKWSPELLGGTFFGSGVGYTATIKVAPFANYNPLPATPARVTVNGEEATYKKISAKEAEITVKFPETEDVGYDLKLININFHEKSSSGDVVVKEPIFSGLDYSLNDYSATNAPVGKRWIGWSETEGGELVSGVVINTLEDVDYYAVYEDIIGYDFSNKTHRSEKNVKVENAKVVFDGAWVVVTPLANDSASALTLDGMNISSADYDFVEIIYDATLEDAANHNKFGETLIPSLKVNGTDEVALSKVEFVVVNNRASYKYIYDLTINGKPETITSFKLEPYTGKPAWAITCVTLVPNAALTDAVDITGIDVPDTWLIPDETADVNEGYVVESIKWSPEEKFNANGSFKDATAYTVTVVINPVTGSKIATEEATINGEAVDSATLGADGKLVVVKTFAETSALIPFELSVEDAVIDVADGTVTLVPNFSVDLDDKSVTWEIIENRSLADIDKDTGVVKAYYDGVVTVKATSSYNPLVSATAKVTISNQIASYTITFDANTTSKVTNMPPVAHRKLEYILPAEAPVREGFKFAGWSKTPGSKVTYTKDYITEDTTYYALWVRGLSYEFIGENENPDTNISIGSVDYTNYDYANGVVEFSPQITTYNSLDTTIMIQNGDKSPLFKGSDYPKVEVRIKSTMASVAKHKIYYHAKAASSAGKDVPEFAEKEAVFTDPAVTVGPDGYTELVFDMSSKTNWMEGNITSLRFDPLDSGASFDHLESVLTIDYIRAVSYETDVIEVTGVDAPVSKAFADTDAVSADESKYVVSQPVTWEGDKLAYDYYFGAEKVYTACVTVKGAPGYCVSNAPVKATVNGKPATATEYNPVTGELTLKYTFPKTEPVDNEVAYKVNLYGMDDNGNRVNNPRTVYEGNSFEIGTHVPENIPTGMRWIGWSEKDDAKENTVGESVVVDGEKTFYAVFEELVEFDYSNYYHQYGTIAKNGKLTFENGLALVTPSTDSITAAIVTPAMNIDGKDFSLVEVYYNATLGSVINGTEYYNRFSAALKPALKFSKVGETDFFEGTLIGSDSVVINGVSYRKYIYDMSGSAAWNSGKIANLQLDSYAGYPAWGVGFIKLVSNTEITDTAEFELATPATWEKPATAADISVGDKYEVVSVEWSPATEVFAADTPYTVNITYKPVAGYKVTEVKATINGEVAEITDNQNGTYKAKYVFDMTDSLKNVNVAISGDNTINIRGGYLDLEATVTAEDGSSVPETGVTWIVDNKNVASISDNGRVYPISNGKVVVTATSKYNPKAKATITVNISNQYDLVKVTFDKNTYKNVENLPEPVYVYGNFVPETYSNFKRNDGYFLVGWSVDEDALEPDESFNITEDTTLYAKWGAGYEWSFDSAATSLGAVSRDVEYTKDGVAIYGPNKDPNSSGQIIFEKDGLNTLGIDTATHKNLEIKISLPVASQVKYYLRASLADGKDETVWNESANTNSISQSLYPANKPGEFQVVDYDLSSHATWGTRPYARRIRFDLPQAGPDGGVQIDYVRLLSSARNVKFDANGGLVPFDGYLMTSTPWQTYEAGTISLPEDPSRDGYVFVGWAKDPVNYRKLYKDSFTLTDETILYAIWADATVIEEEKVSADGAQVNKNEATGEITITSEEETTPVVQVADTLTVGENKTLLIKVRADYASAASEAKTVLTFVDANGTPREVVVSTGELMGDETLVVDLSEEDGFEGTVTDVMLSFASGVINELTIGAVAFVSDEVSSEFEEEIPDVPANNDDVPTSTGGNTKPVKPSGTSPFPSLGGGAISERPSSTTSTSDKKVNVPARPKDETPEQETTTPTTPTTPSASSKFQYTSTYDNRFTDVATTSWYAADVEKSYELGLMNGKSETDFAPDGTVTLAEAITVAARMNAIYNGQTITQGTGNSWYKPYVEYATKKAIVTSGQYSDYNALATREQVAVMFVRSLPASWYEAKNVFNKIPDVPAGSSSFAAIQRLYNAGVIIGVDNAYNFKPSENIKRSELSAIINRVALKDSRLRVVTEDEKNNLVKTVDTAWLLENGTVGNCVEKTFVEKDGLAYAMPAKNDPIVNNLHTMLGGSTISADEYKTITVVVKPEKASDVPTGHQAKIYYTTATATLSESNTVRVGWPKPSADGTVALTFKMDTNPTWSGDVTFIRFDPFDLVAGFSVISISFAP